MIGDVLSQRALNRALLARQLLLRREARSPLATIEHLVGMQAQEPDDPYIALWSRLEEFRPEALSTLIAERQAVRAPLLRTTIHLVAARDALALRPLVEPVMRRTFNGTAWSRNVGGASNEDIAAAGRAALEERPRTRAELGALLRERWPDADTAALAWAVSYLVPTVQVPPRGLWGERRRPTLTTLEVWLGRPLDPAPSPEEFVLRYLAAFGPATTSDIRTWSGIPGLREVVNGLRPGLIVFRDERGRELFDLPDAPRPDPETPAPPRFLPEYDNILLSHADRGRIIPNMEPIPLPAGRGGEVGSLLLDGFLAGMWRIAQDRRAARLVIEPAGSWTPADRVAVEEEGARLLALVASDVPDRDVEMRPGT
jgi:hypothetical protein